ncbi:imidazolonepropionase [Scopulibacillus darangshiensis]|uniref:Imidazolonepropionase n=1 Tax=Scopulibacillus darangshiensis TaxID=442528 RepID=A0A4R2NIN6_9BACL|nr:imidazolonepropionase [Scopulibacillus darangshiensis]TCP21065.1 imidazolonepropionase [Scopulibacillus darangshiensis]
MSDQGVKPIADLVLSNASEVITCTGDHADALGKIVNGWVAISGDRIVAVGTKDDIEAKVDMANAKTIDASGKVIVPGFVDCHTHAVFGGSRVAEYAAKMTVNDPEKLKKMGVETGVQVTVRKTQEASLEELSESASERLLNMMAAGTTTVEIKTGYGFTVEDEMKMLEANAALNKKLPIDVVSTFLGAHGWPEDMSKEAYIDLLIQEMIPQASELGHVTFNDVWCEDSHFTVQESERILKAGADMGLKPKIHTDAYSNIGGSDLAADMKVVSADHLNYTPSEVLPKLAKAGVTGVIMPVLDFAVGHKKPFNARAIIDSGMSVALATDLCPGCWTESMQFVMALACRLYQMSPAEAIRAATLGGAKALDLDKDRGSIEAGKRADLQIWNVSNFEHVIYRLGGNVVEQVIKNGKIIADRSKSKKVMTV